MSFDYSEFKKFRDSFAEADKDLDRFLTEFLLEEGIRALTITKENTPVDTGLLRNMWQLGDSHNVIRLNKEAGQKYIADPERSKTPTIKSVKRSGNDLVIELYNNVEYASHIEDGHKQTPGRYVPAIGKKLVASKVEGKHMARLAITQIEKEIPARFENEFKKWLERLEKL